MKEPKVKFLSTVAQPDKPTVPFGLKETFELLDLFAALNDAYNHAKADGTIEWKDLPFVVAVVPKVLPALNGLSLIPEELNDVNLDEAEEIIKEVAIKFNITNEDAKVFISNSIKALYHIKEAVKVFPKIF